MVIVQTKMQVNDSGNTVNIYPTPKVFFLKTKHMVKLGPNHLPLKKQVINIAFMFIKNVMW